MRLILENKVEKSRLESIFFNRPVGPLHKRNIGILAGRHVGLFDIERAYAIIHAMNHHPILLADSHLRSLDLPVDLYLKQDKHGQLYENTDKVTAAVEDCHVLLVGIGLELNSSMQLLLEKILNTYHGTVVLTDTALTLPSIKKMIGRSTMVFASIKNLLKQDRAHKNNVPNGVLKKIDAISSGFAESQASIVCTETSQVVALDFHQGLAGIINPKRSIDIVPFLATLICLIADRSEPLAPGWLDYLFASSYLYRNTLEVKKNPQSIKDFLNSQF